jgi:hypothetical protein
MPIIPAGQNISPSPERPDQLGSPLSPRCVGRSFVNGYTTLKSTGSPPIAVSDCGSGSSSSPPLCFSSSSLSSSSLSSSFSPYFSLSSSFSISSSSLSSSSLSSSSCSICGAGRNPAYRTSALEAVCTLTPV